MSETQTTTLDADATVTAQPTVPAGPTLGIDDIKNAVKIIDFASEQGAFKGWKVIEQVLLVRNRLNDFAKSVAPDTTPTDVPDVNDTPSVPETDTDEVVSATEGN
jgi:hypothetical protein